MWYIFISIIVLGIITAVVARIARHLRKVEPEPPKMVDSGCCGAHEVCEKETLLQASLKDIVYFDDQELDLYQGRSSDDYTPDEIDQFAEVLYTLQPREVRSWLNSIHLRGVALPDILKDEAYLLIETHH